jgi:hypothetical protein
MRLFSNSVKYELATQSEILYSKSQGNWKFPLQNSMGQREEQAKLL